MTNMDENPDIREKLGGQGNSAIRTPYAFAKIMLSPEMNLA
jgi:hypothetical protein